VSVRRIIAAFFLSTTLVVSGSSARALDETYYSGNDILFFNPDATCTTSGDVAVSDPIDTPAGEADRARIIMQYFVDKGLTLAAAAGFAGNMKQESGLNPGIIQGGAFAAPAQKSASGTVTNTGTIYKPVDSVGFGLVQWTFGGTVGPRQGPLYQGAVRKKVDIIDMKLQLDYVWQELTTNYKTSTLDRVTDMNDPVEAAIVIHDNYEISADSDAEVRSVRGGNAQRYFDLFKNKIADKSGATIATETVNTASGNPCDVQADSRGGLGIIDGFVYPLKTTQTAIKKGIGGAVWCFQSETNCHHDYNAADIFAETGTPIVAAAAGKVVSVKLGSCAFYGCNVTIMGDDGILYYYTHMSKQATVRQGQSVQAGDVVGAVGTDATAMNTPRHLHFDMLPGDKYKFRPGCSSASCTSYPFINVQTNLVPAFNELPEGG
jgi:murein DD-endopeptidase MepM/ murein hydrolase activator NlpD